MKKKILLKRFAWSLLFLFLALNIIAAMHAYKFTHFTTEEVEKSGTDAGFWEKAKMAITGIDNPRPENLPANDSRIKEVVLDDDYNTSCWYAEADSSIGTAIICHGYGGCKSSMLDKMDQFLKMHYSVLVPDFMGCGETKGNQCTIGYFESKQVTACYNYLVNEKGEENVVVFGTSMGAVAIMKSLSEDSISPHAAILECPFGSMYKTTCARFDMMGMPGFPMAGLLVFWGGVENGFWAFGHNPVEYAKNVNVPVLLLYGEKDPKVSREEIDEIYTNLKGTKQLLTFPEAGHENYLNEYGEQWQNAVQSFLDIN